MNGLLTFIALRQAKGTDVIFIEKVGIPDELKEHADKYGVAMVNSRGYLTEFAHDLMIAAERAGANIMIITDYDLSGVNLASKCKNVLWITMDDETLAWFGLDKYRDAKKLVVSATNTKLIDNVTKLRDNDIRFSSLDITFLKTKRIEINAGTCRSRRCGILEVRNVQTQKSISDTKL